MHLFNHKKICVAAMIVMMVASTLFNGIRQVDCLADSVVGSFTKGDPTSHGYGIQYSLDKRVVCARNMLSLCINTIGASHPFYIQVQQILEQMEHTDRVSELYQYNGMLQSAIDQLYAETYTQLNTTKADNLKGQYAIFNAEQEAIGFDSYNAKVLQYEQETDGVLGKFFRNFVSNVEYFR